MRRLISLDKDAIEYVATGCDMGFKLTRRILDLRVFDDIDKVYHDLFQRLRVEFAKLDLILGARRR